jgi:hypothetical protein
MVRRRGRAGNEDKKGLRGKGKRSAPQFLKYEKQEPPKLLD